MSLNNKVGCHEPVLALFLIWKLLAPRMLAYHDRGGWSLESVYQKLFVVESISNGWGHVALASLVVLSRFVA